MVVAAGAGGDSDVVDAARARSVIPPGLWELAGAGRIAAALRAEAVAGFRTAGGIWLSADTASDGADIARGLAETLGARMLLALRSRARGAPSETADLVASESGSAPLSAAATPSDCGPATAIAIRNVAAQIRRPFARIATALECLGLPVGLTLAFAITQRA